MRRGHGGSGDGVGGVLAADPGRQDVEARSEDVGAFAEVGEVCTLVSKGSGSDSNGFVGRCRRVVARVGVIVASGDGEVKTKVHGCVDGQVERSTSATTKTHVGGASLETLALSILGLLHLILMSEGGPLNALNDIRHSTRAIRLQHLHGHDICLLCNSVLFAGNCTRAVSAVTVAVLIDIVTGDGFAPFGAAFEIDMLEVGTSVDNIDIHAFATLPRVQILVEGGET